jgi:exopolysaccharide biosynthesis polyprenyl glycosylphosphotransferase
MKSLFHPLAGGAESAPATRGSTAQTTPKRGRSTASRLARRRLATDVVMLILAGAIEALSAPAADVNASPGWRLIFGALVLLLLGLRGEYRATLGQRFLDSARTILTGTAFAAMIVTFLRVLVEDQPEVAEQAIRSWLFAAVYLVSGRAVLTMFTERFNRLREGGAPTLILGAGQVGHLIARRLLAHPEFGLRPVGFVDPDPLDVERPSGLPVLGTYDDLDTIVTDHGVENAIFSFSSAPHDIQLGISRELRRKDVSVAIIPRMFEGVPDRITLERIGGLPLVSIYPSDPKDWRVSVKYAIDRAFALLAILVVSPLLIFAALGTRLTAGSPIFFRQRRVGLDGHEFEMLKFRSMRVPNPEERARDSRGVEQAIEQGLGPGGREGQERVTRFGAFLRKVNIDELPQLFNVLRGDMSIVGPRPERSSYVEVFKNQIRRYSDRHQVKAGITGWAQVHGLRGDTSLDDRIEWDNYYIENWSPWLDLKILLLTVLTLFRARS